MLENNINDLKLRVRIIEGEIRETKREKEKCWDSLFGLVLASFIFLGIGSYYFFAKKEMGEEKTPAIILGGILLLIIPILGFYWYNKYKKASKKIAELEKELKRLKEGLKE